MRVLLTMNLPYTRESGGTNRSNRSLMAELSRRGHASHAVVPALATPSPITRDAWLRELAAQGVSVASRDGFDQMTLDGVDVRAFADAARLREGLRRSIEAIEPDWVLVSAEDPSQSLLLAALSACPDRVIYLAHTPQMFPFGPSSLYPSAKRTELVRRCRAVMAISHFVRDYVELTF